MFFTDYVHGTISEVVAGSAGISSSSTIKTVASGLSYPFDPAVDANGDVFVTNQGDGTVREILAVNGSIPPSSMIQFVAGGFNQPSFLTIDGNNNIFVSDSRNGAVKEILALNGSIPPSPSIITVATGFNGSVGLATDAAEDLIIANAAYNEIDEYLAINGSLPGSPQMIQLTGAFNEPSDVALSGNGNIFVLDTGNNRLVEFDRADPPSLTFASTNVGTTSADSPQMVTLVNSGNLNLTFPIPTSGTNPSISSNFTLDSGGASDCPFLKSGATAEILPFSFISGCRTKNCRHSEPPHADYPRQPGHQGGAVRNHRPTSNNAPGFASAGEIQRRQ